MRNLGRWVLAFLALLIYHNFSLQGTIDPSNLQSQYDPGHRTAITDNKPVPIPSQDLSASPSAIPQTDQPKRIEVDLTNQRVYAYEGNTKVYDFLISSGKWAKTPTGTFQIWIKLRYTRMTGGSKLLHTYYDLPNVPYVMFFYNQDYPKEAGYSLHGTYWHHNFGHPMSHGCINMRTEDAQTLYYWANPGTPVIIYGVAPDN